MYDVIVIGAGAAGMTAALYARRNGKTVLVLESETFGGQIAHSPRVENFPSIRKISGAEFSDNLLSQIMDFGADIELESCESIQKLGEGNFKVVTNYGEHFGRSIILAVGVKHRHLGVAREEELIGHGISYCAICDGGFYKGEEVVLVGDANTALQYALLLADICPKVRIYTLFDKFFAEDVLVKAIKSNPNIEYEHEIKTVGFSGEDELTSVTFERKDGTRFDVATNALFVAIGQIPDNKRFESLVELDKYGYISADETCQTSTAGVFVAGDCRTKKVRQLTTATADGAVAATAACSYVNLL